MQNIEITDKLAEPANVPEVPSRLEQMADITPESKKNNSGESSEEMPSPPAPMADAQSP